MIEQTATVQLQKINSRRLQILRLPWEQILVIRKFSKMEIQTKLMDRLELPNLQIRKQL